MDKSSWRWHCIGAHLEILCLGWSLHSPIHRSQLFYSRHEVWEYRAVTVLLTVPRQRDLYPTSKSSKGICCRKVRLLKIAIFLVLSFSWNELF